MIVSYTITVDVARIRSDKRLPKWIYAVNSLVGGAVIGFFGGATVDHLHHIYPQAPTWMLYVTVAAWFGIGLGAVENALHMLLK